MKGLSKILSAIIGVFVVMLFAQAVWAVDLTFPLQHEMQGQWEITTDASSKIPTHDREQLKSKMVERNPTLDKSKVDASALDIGISKLNPHEVKVVAAEGGKIIQVIHLNDPGYEAGWQVKIEHPGGVTTAYTHIVPENIKIGMEVSKGDLIGKVASMDDVLGKNATKPKSNWWDGSHLHFQVNVDDTTKTKVTLAGRPIDMYKENELTPLPQPKPTTAKAEAMSSKPAVKERIKDKVEQIKETIKEKAGEFIKKQVVSVVLKETLSLPALPVKIGVGVAWPKKALAPSDASKLSDRNAQQQLTPTKVEFTQTFDGLFTQSADAPGSRYGTHSGTLTDGTRVNVKGDSRPGDFTGSFSGQTVAETGYTPATHNNSAFSGSSVGTVSAKGFKEGDLKGTMTVTVPAGTQTATVSGNITIKTDGSLSMPSYSGPVTVNATGAKVGAMSGEWNQSKTR